MKRILTSILMAAGIAGPFVAHVTAQGHLLTADIPFTFVANHTTLPAGQYRLNPANSGGSPFILRNAAGRAIFVMMGSRETAKSANPSLTFACYSKECVLTKITPFDGSVAYTEAPEKNLHQTLGIASMISIKLTAR